ncbi:hypothetical protein [Rhodoglobus vestalii]|uniref:hypothetical protein n=1 Tax=Rhodoglobus vestalii TaxID=193384 RepID=UPI0014772409|nr:hypothetical protein [Rhodoglobus vestalii]
MRHLSVQQAPSAHEELPEVDSSWRPTYRLRGLAENLSDFSERAPALRMGVI